MGFEDEKVTEVVANKWALKYNKYLTKETIFAVMDEIEAHVAGINRKKVLSSLGEVYALASRFAGVLYRPFFKQKPLRIIWALVDRCGEAYSKKNPDKLYISKEIVNEWIRDFLIPQERIEEYLIPLIRLNILERSDRPAFLYKVNTKFFQLVGPVAQYLVTPVEANNYREMMKVVSGITSVYVVAHAVKSEQYMEGGPRIPWFLKLPMIYTLSGLEPRSTSLRIRDLLELKRINDVDSYFVIEKGAPVELWRSIRAEAFGFMIDNNIIEDATPEGYKLNMLWVKMHEEGIKRYIMRYTIREREKYGKIYKGF
jgi:hypothetical protein